MALSSGGHSTSRISEKSGTAQVLRKGARFLVMSNHIRNDIYIRGLHKSPLAAVSDGRHQSCSMFSIAKVLMSDGFHIPHCMISLNTNKHK